MPPIPPNPNAERGTIAIAFVQEALEGVRLAGLDAEGLLREAGISPELLPMPLARVSSERYGMLWHLIARALDDEFFGMDGRRMKPGSFTMLCHAVIHADTLERALRRALRFLHLVLDDLEGELVRDGETALVLLKERDGQPARAFAYGTFLIMLHGLACWLVGRRIPLSRADFRCAEPVFAPEWRVLFSRELHFGTDRTGIVFSSEFLDMPVARNERSMKEFLRGAPANFLVKYRNSDSLGARIRRRLKEVSPEDWPDFDTLAQQLHASPATLRRHLEREGHSYQGLKDELRRDLAVGCLCHSAMTIHQIANTLGFAETSAFHRAFKKWTGASPGEYRREVATLGAERLD